MKFTAVRKPSLYLTIVNAAGFDEVSIERRPREARRTRKASFGDHAMGETFLFGPSNSFVTREPMKHTQNNDWRIVDISMNVVRALLRRLHVEGTKMVPTIFRPSIS
jgi:hypothetical protein